MLASVAGVEDVSSFFGERLAEGRVGLEILGESRDGLLSRITSRTPGAALAMHVLRKG